MHLRIPKTRRSLATDHDLLAIHMPHTRFIHTSRLHIVTSAALSLSALIRSCPLARHTLAHLTLPIVWFVRASKRALISLLNVAVISVCLCTSCSARCLPDALLFALCDDAAATLIALHIIIPTRCQHFTGPSCRQTAVQYYTLERVLDQETTVSTCCCAEKCYREITQS